jgi:hypothetical protein
MPVGRGVLPETGLPQNERCHGPPRFHHTLTVSHDTSRRSPHSRPTDQRPGVASPGKRVLTASFATRASRVQIPSAPLTTLVRAYERVRKATVWARSVMRRATNAPQDRALEPLFSDEVHSHSVLHRSTSARCPCAAPIDIILVQGDFRETETIAVCPFLSSGAPQGRYRDPALEHLSGCEVLSTSRDRPLGIGFVQGSTDWAVRSLRGAGSEELVR